MPTLLFTGISGWALVAAVAITISLPYLLRRRARAGTQRRPLLQRLRPHYWLGYIIAIVALAHAVAPMAAGLGGRTSQAGLYLATGALLLVFSQIFLGLLLREPSTLRRQVIRRRHFWGMVALVVLALGHIALNSALIQGILPHH